ncbi:TfoX/Sxy family protein [Actinomycetota bacterium]
MAYDEDLAARVRDLLEGEPGVTERKMFGGLAFMVDGHMAVVTNHLGGLMLRCGPETARELTDEMGIRPMVMGGRTMRGWLQFDPGVVSSAEILEDVVARGLEHARALPPKQRKRPK